MYVYIMTKIIIVIATGNRLNNHKSIITKVSKKKKIKVVHQHNSTKVLVVKGKMIF